MGQERGSEFQPADILKYFEELKLGPNKEIGAKDIFEMASNTYFTPSPFVLVVTFPLKYALCDIDSHQICGNMSISLNMLWYNFLDTQDALVYKTYFKKSRS